MTPTAAEKVLAIKFRSVLSVCICVGCAMWTDSNDCSYFMSVSPYCFSFLFLYVSLARSLSLFLSLVLPLPLLAHSLPYIHMQLCPLCSDTKIPIRLACIRRILVTVCPFCVFILLHSLKCEWCACHRLEAMTTKCYSIRAYSIVNIRLRK